MIPLRKLPYLFGAAVVTFGAACSKEKTTPPPTAITQGEEASEDVPPEPPKTHPRLIGAEFAENLAAVPLAARLPGSWESVDASAVADQGLTHVSLDFKDDGTFRMVSYGETEGSEFERTGTFRVESDQLVLAFSDGQANEAKTTFDGDAFILEDVQSGAKVRLRKRVSKAADGGE